MSAIEEYLADCRQQTLADVRRRLVPRSPHGAELYRLMLDYPLRPAKGLRPALCIATCRLFGGTLDAALPSATALELYHNAFLLHDDVEDGSELRRKEPALHVTWGTPVAINVGDGLLAMALEPLLDNMRVLGLGPALRILQTFSRMSRESAEGQQMELTWMRAGGAVSERDYVRMVYKKTGWYTFLTPLLAGAEAASASAGAQRALARFGTCAGIAFQIADDLLSLEADVAEFGKDADGDLWEGKVTLMVVHALRILDGADRARLVQVLGKSRPPMQAAEKRALWDEVSALELSSAAREQLQGLLAPPQARTLEDVLWMRQTLIEAGSLDYARGVARAHAERGLRSLDGVGVDLDNPHGVFLKAVGRYALERTR